jgi:hypothetical protein
MAPEVSDDATREARQALDAVCDEMYNEGPLAQPEPQVRPEPQPAAEPSRAWSGFGWLKRKRA